MHIASLVRVVLVGGELRNHLRAEPFSERLVSATSLGIGDHLKLKVGEIAECPKVKLDGLDDCGRLKTVCRPKQPAQVVPVVRATA